jgi:hypothetical protein
MIVFIVICFILYIIIIELWFLLLRFDIVWVILFNEATFLNDIRIIFNWSLILINFILCSLWFHLFNCIVTYFAYYLFILLRYYSWGFIDLTFDSLSFYLFKLVFAFVKIFFLCVQNRWYQLLSFLIIVFSLHCLLTLKRVFLNLTPIFLDLRLTHLLLTLFLAILIFLDVSWVLFWLLEGLLVLLRLLIDYFNGCYIHFINRVLLKINIVADHEI